MVDVRESNAELPHILYTIVPYNCAACFVLLHQLAARKQAQCHEAEAGGLQRFQAQELQAQNLGAWTWDDERSGSLAPSETDTCNVRSSEAPRHKAPDSKLQGALPGHQQVRQTSHGA